MSVEIIVRPTLGSYTARAKGHNATASRSEGARQAAEALVRKLNIGAGQLQKQPSTDLPNGQQRFQFVRESEMTECQFHNNCGGWCETQRELEHNLCEHCLETHDEEMEQSAELHDRAPVAWSSVKPIVPGAYWIRGNGLSRPALIEVVHEHGQLRCNLHDRTTCEDFGFGYSIEQLSEKFEFSGPLHVHAKLGATVERDERAEFEAAWREVHRHEGKSPFLRIEPSGNYRWGDVHEGWLMWQARAALETKCPVAPVEHYEREQFETCIRREWPQAPISRKRDLLPEDDPCYGDYCDEPLQRAWVGWQMRATLEKKP